LLLRIAPDLVKLQDFIIPVYRNTRRRPWQIQTGLTMYALLGNLAPHGRFDRLPVSRWQNPDDLGTDGLQAVFRYQDAQTDDALLTRAVMSSAESLGAELLESARFVTAIDHDDNYAVRFECAGQVTEITARTLVNAAGPWAAKVATFIAPNSPQPATQLVQGSHIVLDKPRVQGIYYLEAPQDQRAVFVMPWRQQTLVGTTEVPFDGSDPGSISPHRSEIDYLQEVVRNYFPRAKPSMVASFAGLRVLPAQDGRAFGRTRELLISGFPANRPRVLHVYGGKLTSYRADAVRAVKQLEHALPARRPRADTRQLRLRAV
jgi:glycerol-3-phosphate dehydrogenase